MRIKIARRWVSRRFASQNDDNTVEDVAEIRERAYNPVYEIAGEVTSPKSPRL